MRLEKVREMGKACWIGSEGVGRAKVFTVSTSATFCFSHFALYMVSRT